MKLFDAIAGRLQRKVLVALLGVGIIPYFFIMLYFTYWGRDVIVQRELQTHRLQAEQTKTLIQNRLYQLEREIVFLAGLELFDDMISGDIDQRIVRLLERKRSDLQGEAITLLAVDTQGAVVAASQAEAAGARIDLAVLVSDTDSGTVVSGESLILYSALKASFDGRLLGYLVARYPLENLGRYVVSADGVRFVIGDGSRVLTAGPQEIAGAEGAGERRRITVTAPFEGGLKGHQLSYSVSEEHYLGFINRFLVYLTLLFILGVGFIIWMGRRFSSEVVGPVEALTNAADAIIRTGKYDLRVHSDAADETGTLAAMFNRLIATTEEALERLGRENQVRMQRFVDLTDIFNHITRIDDEHACITASIEQLSRIVPDPLSFVPAFEPLPRGCVFVPMQLTDFGSGEQLPYGYLVIGKAHFEDEIESRFFTSVAAMIALQVERIGLIKQIRSASAAKSAFISNMSHELRTPLNAIIGYSQYLMAYEALSDDQIETVAKIEKGALHLLGMINDILDIAKIEAGRMEVQRRETDLCGVLRESLEMVAPIAEEKGLRLESTTEQCKVVIQSDAKLLKQVFINLLSNAIKFTESGGVEVSVAAEPSLVVVTISDTGIGIEPDSMEKVFDAFTQLPNSQQAKYKGTGLGLSLSRQIVHTLGGELQLQSAGRGRGTTAVVKLLPEMPERSL